MTHRIHIVAIDTNKIIMRQDFGFSSWDVIADAVAAWFSAPQLGYRREDVDCESDEDLNEWILIDGKRVARMEWISDTKEQFAKLHDETMTRLEAAE